MKKIFFLLFSLTAITSQAQINLVGYIRPFNGSSYPVQIDSLGKGGYVVTKDTLARNAITCLRRKYGMAVYVQSVQKLYILKDSNCVNTWVEFSGGSGVFDTVYTQSPIMSKTSGDSNIIYFNADTANAWRGGGGNFWNTSGTTTLSGDIRINGDGFIQFGGNEDEMQKFGVSAIKFDFASQGGDFIISGLNSTTDTTTYKPLAIDGTGKLAPLTSWISGGGIAGSGSQYYVPKWSNSTTLQNSQIFDSVNVGINTTTPAYKLDVNGDGRFISSVTALSNGHRFGNLEINTSSNAGQTGQGIKITGGDATFQLQGSPKAIESMFKFAPYANDTNKTNLTNNNTGIIKVNGGFTNPNVPNLSGNTLWLTPDYNFMRNLQSGTKVRGIYYNPNVDSISNTTHIAFESTSGKVVMKGLKTSNSTTDSIAIWINDTLSKAPYPSGGGGIDSLKRSSDSVYARKNGNFIFQFRDSVGTNPAPVGYYGSFYDTTIQSALVTNTAYGVKLGVTDLSNGVTIANNSKIKFANAGIYNLQFSLQLEKTGGSGNMIADIWLRKNNVNLAGTNGKVVLTGSVNASPIVAAWNYVVAVSSNDSLELMWATDNLNVKIIYDVATSPHPSTASAILTVTQQSGIMAGTGISPLDTANMLSNYARTNLVNTKLNISDTATMLSSYSTRINGKLNINDTSNMLVKYLRKTDTSTLQPKSISSYTILANKTSATANVTAQAFRDTSGVYDGTITWTGTTAPSGATNHTYRLTQVGKCVTINISLLYATNGSLISKLTATLPSNAPTPVQPTGLTSALQNIYVANGQYITSTNTTANAILRTTLRNNTANNGFEFLIEGVSSTVAQVNIICQYWTN